jgi:UDP-glucose 4-epimerase
MNNKKCLVLGANGFIGSHLVDTLAREGYKVVAFDRFSHPSQFLKNENIMIVRGDVSEPSDVIAALNSVDTVFHCYSATTPYSSDIDPYSDITENLLGSVKIFELCVKQDVKKIVYISSGGAIYGSSAEKENGAKETDLPLPVSPYGICKLATERYLDYFSKKYGIKTISYRTSNPYGPRQITKHNQGVVPRFIEHIKERKPIMIYGDGSSSRDYIYIEDAANFIVSSFNIATQQTYNIGSGKQTSLKDLIKALEIVCGETAQVEYLPEPKTFSRMTQLDTTRFIEEFGKSTETSLEEGLSKTASSNNS